VFLCHVECKFLYIYLANVYNHQCDDDRCVFLCCVGMYSVIIISLLMAELALYIRLLLDEKVYVVCLCETFYAKRCCWFDRFGNSTFRII